MKPIHKKIFSYKKASGSTTADNTYAAAALINENGTQVNNATKTMSSMMLQLNSTKTILIIILAAIGVYLITRESK